VYALKRLLRALELVSWVLCLCFALARLSWCLYLLLSCASFCFCCCVILATHHLREACLDRSYKYKRAQARTCIQKCVPSDALQHMCYSTCIQKCVPSDALQHMCCMCCSGSRYTTRATCTPHVLHAHTHQTARRVEVTSLVELATDSWQVSNLTTSHSLHQSESFLVEGILILGFLVGWDWSTQTIGVMKANASGARKP
jgi:hypothetical protein